MKKAENYLERKPMPAKTISWKVEEEKVTISVENRGMWNRILQKLLARPKISYIHLDTFGSFVFREMDGEKTILEIGERVEAVFGEEANPLYERLATFCARLESYGFISFTD